MPGRVLLYGAIAANVAFLLFSDSFLPWTARNDEVEEPLQWELQWEQHEQKVTPLDVCRWFTVTYDMTNVKDLDKLPRHVQREWASHRCVELLERELVAEPVAPTRFNVADCARLREAYRVVRADDWGSLPASMHGAWIASKCDELLQNHPQQSQHQQLLLLQPEAPDKNGAERLPKQHTRQRQKKKDDPPSPAMGGLSPEAAAECKKMSAEHHVYPGKSWGTMMSETTRNYWRSLNCEEWYWASVMAKTGMPSCPPSNRNAAVVIAILVASTTRRVVNPGPSSLALCRWLLPSVVKSLDCGFRFKFVLGYDEGDTYFDSPKGLSEMTKWFEDNVQEPLERSNIIIEFTPVRLRNELQKPGPVFLEIAKKAYQEGADYFYRLNDDTQLVGRWPSIYVQALQSLGEPYGVVGPVCRQGNTKILTHDFTHRTHMEIFDMQYYPPELTDWWMDDWISSVYGSQRTIQVTATEAIHHTGAHGQRYAVDASREKLLSDLVRSGREKIRHYMVKTNVKPAMIKQFDEDTRMNRVYPSKDFVLSHEGQLWRDFHD